MARRTLQRLKNDLIYAGARLLMAPFAPLSLDGASDLGAALGRLAFLVATGERRRALRHMRIALGAEYREEQLHALVRGCFEHLGRSAGELLAIRSGRVRPEELVVLDDADRERVDRARALGRGLIGVTGHLGNWEVMAMGVAALGFPVNTVARRSYDPRFDRMIESFRKEHGVHCLYRRDPDLGQRAADLLARNEMLGLLIDQDTRVPSVFADFFGRPAATPLGASWLARRHDCPLLTFFTFRRDDGRHQVVVSDPIPPSHATDLQQALAEDTAEYNRRIEAQIREHPEQWVWMHQRWKTRPAEPHPGRP